MSTLLKNTAPIFAKGPKTPGHIQDTGRQADKVAHKADSRQRQAGDHAEPISVYHFVKDLDASSGGLSRSVPQICRALSHQGTDVSIISRRSAAPVALDGENCCLLNAHARHANRWLSERCSNPRSIIHVNGLWLPFLNAGARYAHAANMHYVISPRGMTAPWAMRHKRLKKAVAWRLYQRRILQNATCLHATADSEMENLRQLGITAPIAVIPNGVEIISDQQLSELKKTRSERANPEIRTLLFLGRIQKVKGLENLMRAWAKVRQPGWRIQIVGPEEDNHKLELKRLAQRLGIFQDIIFCGPQSNEDKWKTYSNADVFVLPTHTENFGLTVAEALSCETPVITTKGAPWSEINEHRCGWWIDIGVEPLAQSIEEAINLSDANRAEMGQRGRKMVQHNYGWSGIARQVNEVYAWICGQNTKPTCVKSLA